MSKYSCPNAVLYACETKEKSQLNPFTCEVVLFKWNQTWGRKSKKCGKSKRSKSSRVGEGLVGERNGIVSRHSLSILAEKHFPSKNIKKMFEKKIIHWTESWDRVKDDIFSQACYQVKEMQSYSKGSTGEWAKNVPNSKRIFFKLIKLFLCGLTILHQCFLLADEPRLW